MEGGVVRNIRSTKTTQAALLNLSATGQPADAVNAARLDGGSRAPVLLHHRFPTSTTSSTPAAGARARLRCIGTGVQPSA